MLFRLFKPNNALGRSGLLGLGAVWLVLGCGSKFSANPSADSGGSSSGSGGGGASAGTGGTAGTPGTAGTGGKPATGCNCAAGSYCPEGTKTCSMCNDFSVLSFAAPEKLATISQSQAGNERFPRAASAGTDLFYRAGLDGKPSIWYAATPISGVGEQVSGMEAESGPLFAPNFSQQNFFFDRQAAATNLRRIMAGVWSGGALTAVSAVPSPLNGLKGEDFSVAIAADVKRVYWMSTRNNDKIPDLVWTTFNANTPEPAVLNLDVQVGVGKKCARLGDDATPWVNAAGTLLLFRSESMDDTCQPSDAGAFDLFATPLGKDGLPLTPGTPLANLNSVGSMSSETDPSLSHDSCTIYFASDGGKGDFDLYRAARN